MSDHIRIDGVRAFGYHGVLPEERRDGQQFVVDLDVELDVTAAAASDDLGKTVDYAGLAQRTVEIVQSDPVNLIETVAVRIAEMVLADALLAAVTVTLHKPQAPVGVPFSDVSVTVRRSRP